ncbi:adenosylmethionine--8-amino-7-oxononanoate transaminase [Jatrophihabitans sp.]|uniref:adenosylmethionine--8-amino-7-oxononanoate transaminase n=1 Tax=Jatrophihabitans sp. TaxID=1932789 RepID=UPI002C96C2EC|nr:adenosylmethionine--8-amino-7-oxononanoate transaminase [Jatrophihabitans sp.]
MAEPAELLAFDRQHVWHPYAAMPAESAPLLVESASGVRLRLAGGRELIDGMSSWWAAIHGYRHPVLDAAVRRQLGSMSHVMFGGLTHQPAIELARRLVGITAEPLQHVFFTDSGSVAVEVAAKMALQYWVSAGRPDKHRLITWRGGYHGDTLHPMSVCDPVGGMHALWQPVLPAQVFVDAPPAGFDAEPDPDYLARWDRALAEHADSLAAIIVEPVVQGAGGMRFTSPGYLAALRELADRHRVLLIFDEIATGFGRTGALFAADHAGQAGVAPDICCLGKAMTGGYLSMAATLCTGAVAEQISRGPVPVLAHGPTFMANPLAAAVSLASIELLLASDWRSAVGRIEAGLRRELDPLAGLPGVADVRVLGAIGVVQLAGPVDVAAATEAAVEQGVWLRPFRDLIYTMPAYLMSEDELAVLGAGLRAATLAGAAAGGARG